MKERNAELQAAVAAWITPVLQPGPVLYDGFGVARPSAFIAAGAGFASRYQYLFILFMIHLLTMLSLII